MAATKDVYVQVDENVGLALTPLQNTYVQVDENITLADLSSATTFLLIRRSSQ